MNDDRLYTSNDITTTYEQVYDLLVTKDIIKTYSTNKTDIRNAALNEINLNGCRDVLELGCGYGFFIESLAGRLHTDARITGIDIVSNNRHAYLHNISAIGYTGEFIQGSVEKILDMPDKKFDLIIASYSLYFFPHLIQQISRLLKKDGLFITITHSEISLQPAVDIITESLSLAHIKVTGEIALSKLFKKFSSANGYDKLAGYFSDIKKIDYINSLIFPHENIDDCMYYIEKKKNLIYKEILDSNPDRIEDFKRITYTELNKYSIKNKGITLNKDDAVFICRK